MTVTYLVGEMIVQITVIVAFAAAVYLWAEYLAGV